MTDPASPNPAVPRLNAALEGRYSITSELGEGGMATVYLAEDHKHNRKVALKVLKPELAAVVGAERFLTEIQVTANLQHPHILPLHDSGEADSFLFYVMPYVEGESLRDRLNREQQLHVDEAVKIATDLAEALDYAHRAGVVHRDIKPANILMHEGRPLIADFGIALAVGAAGGTRLTETGLSVGTPYYMSPEQATGDQVVGPATDIYALGCVLYEMLVGEPPFPGATAQAVLGKIISGKAVAAAEQRPSIPANVDAAIRCALEKLPADRFTTAQEFAAALKDDHFRHGEPKASEAAAHPGPWRRVAAGLGTLAVFSSAVAAWAVFSPEPPGGVLRYSMTLPLERGSQNAFGSNLAVSPDGAMLAYVGAPEGPAQLWIRDRHDLVPRMLSGGEGAHQPFFSPDGDRIAFITIGRALRIVSLTGEPPVTLADSGIVRGGGAWGSDGNIYLVSGAVEGGRATLDGLARMPATGGPITVVSTLDTVRAELGHFFPDVLPGARGVIFTVGREQSYDTDFMDIAVLDLSTGTHRVLLEGIYARWAASGHIIVVRADGSVVAAPFDEKTLELTGPATPLFEGVGVEGQGSVDLDVSKTGTIIYEPGEALAESGSDRMVWVTRSGGIEDVDPSWTGDFSSPTLSPDGTRLALNITVGAESQVWVKQLDQGPLSKLTFEERYRRPSWTPDGQTVIFLSKENRDNDELFQRRADGSVPSELVLSPEGQVNWAVVSSDGQWLVYQEDANLYARMRGEDDQPVPLVVSEFIDAVPALSPNGRWIAYVSNESGRFEVYVRPFPNTDQGKWLISPNGGGEPRWAKDGSELFYRDAERQLVAVEILTGPTFTAGEQRTLFPTDQFRGGVTQYDVSPDGDRFLFVARGDTEAIPGQVIVVENFFEELQERVSR